MPKTLYVQEHDGGGVLAVTILPDGRAHLAGRCVYRDGHALERLAPRVLDAIVTALTGAPLAGSLGASGDSGVPTPTPAPEPPWGAARPPRWGVPEGARADEPTPVEIPVARRRRVKEE